eukprot:3907541-Pyramimonas_sp.AAC.1
MQRTHTTHTQKAHAHEHQRVVREPRLSLTWGGSLAWGGKDTDYTSDNNRGAQQVRCIGHRNK